MPPDKRSGPDTTPDRSHKDSDLAAEAKSTIAASTDSEAVLAKLWRLRDHYGYFTRAELGAPAPRGHWECPGEFGPDGRFRAHCGSAA
jgi:hypothetical protein